MTRLVLCTIREHALVSPGDRVAIALSGGADSVALVSLLTDLASGGDLGGGVAGLIHVNHGLRGAESARDEQFCRGLASRLGLSIETASIDVAALARAARRSVEAAARDARYRFFTEAAARLGATAVATGHTLDDQAETVLLRLLRGAGSRGLSGIRIRRGSFIRPLLRCRRDAVRQYLRDRGEAFCEDSSNRSLEIARNRIRHRLLPVIEDVAPGGVEALARLARLSADDEAYLEEVVSATAGSVVFPSTGIGVQLDVGALAGLPRAIGRRVVRRALEQVEPGRAFQARHVDAVLGLADRPQPGGHVDLPRVSVERRGITLLIGPAAAAAGWPARPLVFEVTLPVPGRAEVPEANVAMTASVQVDGRDAAGAGGETAVVQAAALALPLIVRSRRPGDRLRPLGAPGRRKLQDLLVDRKVPRAERDRVPIVVDAAGRIVWVAGLTIAEEYRVTAPAAGVVVLKMQKRTIP